jgi:hypothetical protein
VVARTAGVVLPIMEYVAGARAVGLLFSGPRRVVTVTVSVELIGGTEVGLVPVGVSISGSSFGSDVTPDSSPRGALLAVVTPGSLLTVVLFLSSPGVLVGVATPDPPLMVLGVTPDPPAVAHGCTPDLALTWLVSAGSLPLAWFCFVGAEAAAVAICSYLVTSGCSTSLGLRTPVARLNGGPVEADGFGVTVLGWA